MKQNLILFGYKASGKTHFGKLLSKELGTLFIDTDQLIEEFYEKECGQKSDCRQISIKVGEEGFRELEKRVIQSLGQMIKAVISLGGGAILDLENRFRLEKLGKLIYLETDKEIIRKRIFSGGTPYFLIPLILRPLLKRCMKSGGLFMKT